jgi:hypothetical protein
MLSVLFELHNEPDLKLNHKFEFEVCKNLNLNINDIAVKGVLRNFEVVEEQLTKYNNNNQSDNNSNNNQIQNNNSSSNTHSSSTFIAQPVAVPK